MFRYFLLVQLLLTLSAGAQTHLINPDSLTIPVEVNTSAQNKKMITEIKQKKIYHSLSDSTAVNKYLLSQKHSITKKEAAYIIYQLAKEKYLEQLKVYNEALEKRLAYNKKVESLKLQIEKLASEKKQAMANGNKQKAMEIDAKVKPLLIELDKIRNKETYAQDQVKTQQDLSTRIGNELKKAKNAYDNATDEILKLGK
ncbi:MAG: hypothetical protein U0T11_04605 [Chitinophagaceae bacterium]